MLRSWDHADKCWNVSGNTEVKLAAVYILKSLWNSAFKCSIGVEKNIVTESYDKLVCQTLSSSWPNPFQPSFAFHIETSHLFCRTALEQLLAEMD